MKIISHICHIQLGEIKKIKMTLRLTNMMTMMMMRNSAQRSLYA